jgi:hypothetical protein
MFCDRCGAKLENTQSFCPACGKAVDQAPLMPRQGRIAGHIRLLGILWLVISAIRLIPGLAVLSFFPWIIGFLHLPYFVHGLLHFVGIALVLTAVLGIVAGWGLLERQPWARMLALVLGCINLIKLPFGTALGIYTLWVLLPAGSEEEYRQLARAV